MAQSPINRDPLTIMSCLLLLPLVIPCAALGGNNGVKPRNNNVSSMTYSITASSSLCSVN